MEVEFVKSTDLTPAEVAGLCQLFNSVFPVKMEPFELKKKYLATPLGHSYHSLSKDAVSGDIVGAYTAVPVLYNYCGKRVCWAYSVDTMIAESRRGNLAMFKKLNEIVYSELSNAGISFVYGFPNEKALPVLEKLMKWKQVGGLRYYFRGVSLEKVHAVGGVLQPLANLLHGVARCCKLGALDKDPMIFSLRGDEFKQYRYWSDEHNIQEIGGGYYSWRSLTLQGVEIACLMDVYPFTPALFDRAVLDLGRRVRSSAALIAYIGSLPFTPRSLLCLPKRFEPRNFSLWGRPTGEGIEREELWDMNHWQISLVDFDLV